jgi:WD40 repeat protein
MIRTAKSRRSLGCLLAVLALTPLGSAEPEKSPVPVRSIAVSPDGSLVSACVGKPDGPGQVVIHELASRKRRSVLPVAGGAAAVAFSPDGKNLAVGCFDHAALLISVASGQPMLTLRGHAKSVGVVAFSPDSKILATGSHDQTVKLWNVETGTEHKTLAGARGRILSVAFSPDGKLLAAACGEGAYVWDTATGEVKHTLKHGGYHVTQARFSADGAVLTGGYDGTVRLWDAATGKQRLGFQELSGVGLLAVSDAGKMLAVGHGHDIALFSIDLRPPTSAERDRITALLRRLDDEDYATRETAGRDLLATGFTIEPDLRRQAKESASAEVRIRCRRIWQTLLSRPRAVLSPDSLNCMAFTPDGKMLVSGGDDGVVRLWDVTSAKETGSFVAGETN